MTRRLSPIALFAAVLLALVAGGWRPAWGAAGRDSASPGMFAGHAAASGALSTRARQVVAPATVSVQPTSEWSVAAARRVPGLRAGEGATRPRLAWRRPGSRRNGREYPPVLSQAPPPGSNPLRSALQQGARRLAGAERVLPSALRAGITAPPRAPPTQG